jgi:carboxypeptidase Q
MIAQLAHFLRRIPRIALLATIPLFFPAHLHAAGLYSEADLAVVRQAMAQAQQSDLAYDLVASLTTEVGPRSAGSPGDLVAVAWAKAKLTALGFDRVWTEPVRINAWMRGPARAEIIAPYPQPLAVAALGNSISTPPEGITAELAYYDSFETLKADTSERARGRIVFIDNNMQRTMDGSGYGKAVVGRGNGASEAAKRGALALLIRSIGTDHDRLPHTGGMQYGETIAKIPAAAVSTPDGDLIRRQVQSKQPMTLSLFMQNSSKSNLESFNVLAEMRGSDQSEEIVAIGAHLDSWDLGTGAIDDGAGVAITVAAAKILREVSARQGVKQRRTIRVVLFANEENGFDGAFEYTRMHNQDKHQLVAEADSGAGPVYQIETGVDKAALPWLRELGPLLAPLNITIGGNTGKASSDLGDIGGKYNLPAVSMRQDASRYFDIHHTANDTLDKIDPEQLKQNVAAWTAMVWLATQAGVKFSAPAKKADEKK